jgi:hypothetical protein
MPDMPELFLKAGFIFSCFSCLVLMLGTTLGALVALTNAHAQPLLLKLPSVYY